MRILCEKHHRGPGHGIHMMDFPHWIMQAIKREDFIFSEDEQEHP
jgi:hypothetical protein